MTDHDYICDLEDKAHRLHEEVILLRADLNRLARQNQVLKKVVKMWRDKALEHMPPDEVSAWLVRIVDVCVQDTEEMSEAELDAEIRARGLDPAEVARRTRKVVEDAVASVIDEGECQKCGQWARRRNVEPGTDYGAGRWLCPECIRGRK